MAKDAIALLEEDHSKVRDLLAKLTSTTDRAGKTRQDLLEQIAMELKVHTALEEEIFYPAFREANGKEHLKLYHEALEEHRAVEEMIIPDLQKTDPQSVQFSGRAKVLKELVEHHVEEEEEMMFKMARESLSKDALQELGDKMATRKKALMGKS